MSGPAVSWLDELAAVLDELREREGFVLTGMAGRVLWGYRAGDDTLYVATHERRDFHPCEPLEWEAAGAAGPPPRPPQG